MPKHDHHKAAARHDEAAEALRKAAGAHDTEQSDMRASLRKIMVQVKTEPREPINVFVTTKDEQERPPLRVMVRLLPTAPVVHTIRVSTKGEAAAAKKVSKSAAAKGKRIVS
jgi:hypothetical protein